VLARIPRVQTEDRVINQLQDNVISTVNPLVSNPLLSGTLLQSVSLASGANTVNHLLGRNLIGWFVTRRNNASTIYDTQNTNPLPSKTLTLTTSGAVTVDLFVF
jgi:hypothetical protein